MQRKDRWVYGGASRTSSKWRWAGVWSTRRHAVALSTIGYTTNIGQSSEIFSTKRGQTFVLTDIVAGVVSLSHVPAGPHALLTQKLRCCHPRAGPGIGMNGPQGTDQAERDVSISLEFRETGRSSSPIPSICREKLLPSARRRRQHRDPPR